jgi:hypothetical protein
MRLIDNGLVKPHIQCGDSNVGRRRARDLIDAFPSPRCTTAQNRVGPSVSCLVCRASNAGGLKKENVLVNGGT